MKIEEHVDYQKNKLVQALNRWDSMSLRLIEIDICNFDKVDVYRFSIHFSIK